MRLLVTADLHYNHRKSRPLADALIDRLNAIDADALLLVGDTAPAESPELTQCLSRFQFAGPKLFVPGNQDMDNVQTVAGLTILSSVARKTAEYET